MKHIKELEAWSLPGQLLHSEYSKEVLQKEVWDEGVPTNVFLGISAIPDRIDCENLNWAIQTGELQEKEFNEFCLNQKLMPSLQSEEAAAKFLEYKNGRCLAWIHLPLDADVEIMAKITEVLQSHGHIVIDPEGLKRY